MEEKRRCHKQKSKIFGCLSLKNQTRGQITVFIIIAVIIIAIGALLYLFIPQVRTSLGFDLKNPSVFLQTCIEDEIEDAVNLLSVQGGSINPEHYITYNNEKIEYLCYTEEYYKTCVVQQAMLKKHIESEIKNEVEESAMACLDSLKESYEKKNYDVNLKRGDMQIELLPERVVAKFNSSLILTKDDSEKYESFIVVLNNNLYELVSITNSILNGEASYGDVETTIYMNYYHDLKVEKLKQSDGTTIYILTDRNGEDKFQFASRSVAWPPGYGINEVLNY